MAKKVKDDIAERLEKQGLWRRAAVRWLDVMQLCDTDTEREWVRIRRLYCYSMIKPIVEEKIDFAEIRRAADATQVRMGIDRPGGVSFRLK